MALLRFIIVEAVGVPLPSGESDIQLRVCALLVLHELSLQFGAVFVLFLQNGQWFNELHLVYKIITIVGVHLIFLFPSQKMKNYRLF